MTRITIKPKIARFSFEGPDKKGIIATITGFFFKNGCNILDIDQRILENYLVMNMLVDHTDKTLAEKSFLTSLQNLVQNNLQMLFRFSELGQRSEKNIALLVTSESHCAQAILEQVKAGKIHGKVKVIIGNQESLKSLAQKYKIPFHYVPSEKKREHEKQVLDILDEHQTHLVVLARYMQILSPEFVFRYEGRIINIHPSLLPAFPGPKSYHQAFNKGVDFVGVTAHFVTTDLDQGPVICQENFRVNRVKDTIDDYIQKGRVLESKALVKAVKLYCDDLLSLRRGKVTIGKQESKISQVTKNFYLD